MNYSCRIHDRELNYSANQNGDSMRTIYCFVENEEQKWNTFYEEHEKDMIHVYSSVIESCEDNLFYCFGELFSIFMSQEEKCVFVTDVRKIYGLANILCTPFFEEILFVDSGNTVDFSAELSIKDLIEFELMSIADEKLRRLAITFLKLSKAGKFQDMVELSDALGDKLSSENNSKSADIIAHFCRALNYLSDRKEHILSKEFYVFNQSLLMRTEQNVQNTNRYLECVLEDERYKGNNYYFIWNQIKALRFRKLIAIDDRANKYHDELYQKSYDWFYEQEREKLSWIPNKERKKERVLVLTIQLLDGNHAPSKTVKERVKSLVQMGKEVYLVNTVEQYTLQGYVPFYGTLPGIVNATWTGEGNMDIGGKKVWYYQFLPRMSILQRMELLRGLLQNVKPHYILSIGTGSILADLCSHMIPCFSMSLVFSTLPKTAHSIKVLGRQLTAEEKKNSTYAGVIESRFTFELKPQKEHFTRGQWGIPKDRFLLAVVGIRLDNEVDEVFLEVLEKVCREGCHVLFAGRFQNYDNVCKSHELIQKNSTFVGYCEDILALMEICDLYINPKRQGGGFSVIEAFTKGVPGVYLQMGDVYAAGGAEFSVTDYEEMIQKILKYKDDKEYYAVMSEKAKLRAKKMTSSVEALQELQEAIDKRILSEFS